MQFSDFSKSIDVVNDIKLEKYLGTWYEYARTDVRFEKGMTGTKAQYALMDPDSKGRTRIRVTNSGYKKSGRFATAKGKAVIPDNSKPARLMVSFFGPFYGEYNIIALDTEKYQWALVAGGSPAYLWFLSRDPQMDKSIFKKLKMIADGYGFKTDELIFPQK